MGLCGGGAYLPIMSRVLDVNKQELSFSRKLFGYKLQMGENIDKNVGVATTQMKFQYTRHKRRRCGLALNSSRNIEWTRLGLIKAGLPKKAFAKTPLKDLQSNPGKIDQTNTR